jgi:hypothetical protein
MDVGVPKLKHKTSLAVRRGLIVPMAATNNVVHRTGFGFISCVIQTDCVRGARLCREAVPEHARDKEQGQP